MFKSRKMDFIINIYMLEYFLNFGLTFYFDCKTALFGQQMKSGDWDRLTFDI